jgi:hypothetical protein
MTNWKRNLSNKSTNTKVFEASAAELYYKHINLVRIMQELRTKLGERVNHDDIEMWLEAALKDGLSNGQLEKRALAGVADGQPT